MEVRGQRIFAVCASMIVLAGAWAFLAVRHGVYRSGAREAVEECRTGIHGWVSQAPGHLASNPHTGTEVCVKDLESFSTAAFQVPNWLKDAQGVVPWNLKSDAAKGRGTRARVGALRLLTEASLRAEWEVEGSRRVPTLPQRMGSRVVARPDRTRPRVEDPGLQGALVLQPKGDFALVDPGSSDVPLLFLTGKVEKPRLPIRPRPQAPCGAKEDAYAVFHLPTVQGAK